ncbi:MAG: hypothetical protein QXL94_00555 [Candidatus Parvarchaeum sp.]
MQNWPVKPPATPTLAPSTTGGTIPATTAVYVAVAYRSGSNFMWGGSTAASPTGTATTGSGSTNSVVATSPATPGAVAWDWYVGSSSSTLYYYTTTTVGNVTITAIPTAAATPPIIDSLSSLLPGVGVNPASQTPGNGLAPNTDTSYSTNYYNGVIASSLGDYGPNGPVQPGTGTPSNAVFIDYGGQTLSSDGASIPLFDQINQNLWRNVRLSPTAYMMSGETAQAVTSLLTQASGATMFLPPTDADARTNLAGGGYIGSYINATAGGARVSLEVHPHLPTGTIIARTDRVPFPGSNIGSTFQVRCQYDTMRFDYATNYNPEVVGGGPRFEFEIRSLETLVNTAPSAQAVAVNIAL